MGGGVAWGMGRLSSSFDSMAACFDSPCPTVVVMLTLLPPACWVAMDRGVPGAYCGRSGTSVSRCGWYGTLGKPPETGGGACCEETQGFVVIGTLEDGTGRSASKPIGECTLLEVGPDEKESFAYLLVMRLPLKGDFFRADSGGTFSFFLAVASLTLADASLVVDRLLVSLLREWPEGGVGLDSARDVSGFLSVSCSVH